MGESEAKKAESGGGDGKKPESVPSFFSKLKATSRITLSLYLVVIAIGIYSTGTALKSYLATINLKSYAQPKFEELKISTGKISFDSTDSTSSNTIITTSDGSRILLGCYGPYTRHDCYITEESGYKFSMQKELVGETAIAWWYPIENKPYGRLYQMEVRGRTLFTYDKKVNDYNRGFLRGNRKKINIVLSRFIFLVCLPVLLIKTSLEKTGRRLVANNITRNDPGSECSPEKKTDICTDNYNQVIFAAVYSRPKVILALLINALPFYLIIGIAYELFLTNNYDYKSLDLLTSAFFGLAALSAMIIILDSLLFKQIVFYTNRVTKYYYLLGQITVYYSNAEIDGPPGQFKWLSSAYKIRKTDEYGNALLKQVPMLFFAFFFSKRDMEQINNIINCLTEDLKNNPRIFKKNILNEEELCR
ncbi:MAG TPA: hypothetical protein PL053_12385 [Deltaproteobacteria bacterium]|nr:hypothetical protein [Deltaproteobacteria bacterium]